MTDTPQIAVLTDESYKDFIKEGRVVIHTWDEGCPKCVKYEPIFNEYIQETQVKAGVLRLHVMKEQRPSEFKRNYMRQDKSDSIKETVPGTFVFENGELKARHFGWVEKDVLAKMVSDFVVPKPPCDDAACQLSKMKARAFDLIRTRDMADMQLRSVNEQIEQMEGRRG